ncbi:MAG: glycoside hydrolase family 127 protein, partial [Acidobacteriaceae bacterium]|nr:glycoside hydrolase family 127 protein [Acidobacteriaceae bacterium]
ATDFTVYLRWPGWAPSAEVQVNGQPYSTANFHRGSFIAIVRTWNKGDTVTLSLPMQPTTMVSNPRVADTYGRVALQRGPLIYALEQMDQGGVALNDVFYRPNSPVNVELRKDLLGGVMILKVGGVAAEKSLGDEPLYEPLSVAATRAKRPAVLTFIPYYAMGNREPTPMEVWVPTSRAEGQYVPSTPAAERRVSQ